MSNLAILLILCFSRGISADLKAARILRHSSDLVLARRDLQ
jgi:hypothetical protein